MGWLVWRRVGQETHTTAGREAGATRDFFSDIECDEWL
jgi:hypothetical protein